MGYKHNSIAINYNDEVSTSALRDLIAETRAWPTVPIVVPAEESKSNGAMEARVKTWQSQLRTLLLGLQQCIGCKIPLGNLICSLWTRRVGQLSTEFLGTVI